MDPLILLPAVPVGAGIAAKVVSNKARRTREQEAKVKQISYYLDDGSVQTREVVIHESDDDGNDFDEHGFRIGYSSHYTRELEMEVLGHGLSKCDCWECEENRALEERRAEDARQEVIRIERERREAKEAAERLKRERERIARENAEKQAKFDAMMDKFNSGEFDEQPIRNLIVMGIPKADLNRRIKGELVWPEYAIKGTSEVTYERQEIANPKFVAEAYSVEVDHYSKPVVEFTIDEISKKHYKYFKVTRTFYPNGEMDFVRVEVTKQTFDKHESVRSNMSGFSTKSLNGPQKPIDADWVRDQLAANKKKNEQYLRKLTHAENMERTERKVDEYYGRR